MLAAWVYWVCRACRVTTVGPKCAVLVGPVRSGWACRPLCPHLCPLWWVKLRDACGAGAGRLGMSASLPLLISALWSRIARCLRRSGLSAHACVLFGGVLLSGACGAGAEWLGMSARLRLLVSSLRDRIVYSCGADGEWLGVSACPRLLASLFVGFVLSGACGAGAEWLGMSALLRLFVYALWGRIVRCRLAEDVRQRSLEHDLLAGEGHLAARGVAELVCKARGGGCETGQPTQSIARRTRPRRAPPPRPPRSPPPPPRSPLPTTSSTRFRRWAKRHC